MSEIKKLKFTTISNNGGIEGMSNQCMFISIYHYLKYVENMEYLTVRDIREIGGLKSDTEDTMYDYHDSRYSNCLEKICSYYSIQIKIYYVNKEPNQNKWLGKCQHIFGARNDRKIRIASFGAHFELINKIGTTQFFSRDIVTPTYHNIISEPTLELKTVSEPTLELKTSSALQETNSNMIIEALVINSVELYNDTDILKKTINKLIKEINELDERFRDKKIIYKNTTCLEAKKKIRTELEVIKELGETKKKLVLNYKVEIDKINCIINENMDTTHKLEISH